MLPACFVAAYRNPMPRWAAFALLFLFCCEALGSRRYFLDLSSTVRYLLCQSGTRLLIDCSPFVNAPIEWEAKITDIVTEVSECVSYTVIIEEVYFETT